MKSVLNRRQFGGISFGALAGLMLERLGNAADLPSIDKSVGQNEAPEVHGWDDFALAMHHEILAGIPYKTWTSDDPVEGIRLGDIIHTPAGNSIAEKQFHTTMWFPRMDVGPDPYRRVVQPASAALLRRICDGGFNVFGNLPITHDLACPLVRLTRSDQLSLRVLGAYDFEDYGEDHTDQFMVRCDVLVGKL